MDKICPHYYRKVICVIFILIFAIFLPSIKASFNQATNKEFIKNVENNALSANIKILQLKYRNDKNSIAVSAGASGVIIKKEGNRYFALTAKHVISELDNVKKTQIVVMGYEDQDLKDYLKMGGKYMGAVDYYKQFPVSKVEYTSVKYDLALISFTSDKVYTVLSLAKDVPKYGDKVASMSNPNGKRNIVTAGRIGRKKIWNFEDESGKTKYPITRHSAASSAGSSGSALLNKDLEIVGINIGGGENIFRQFIFGIAMTNDHIHEFLKEWEN